jgi:hypothetical protein
MEPVIDALEEVHDRGMLHLEVNPGNIFVTHSDSVRLSRLAGITAGNPAFPFVSMRGYTPVE